MLELILFGLLTYGFTAVLWCGLICLSFTNTRWRWIGHSATQVSALVVCFELLQMDGVDAVLLALAPPLYVIIFEDQFLRLLPFFGPLLPYATLIGIGVAIMLGPRRFGVWLLFPSVAAAGLALLIMGEFRSKAEMCRTADVTSFHRNTLFWSLRNGGMEWQWELHAMTATKAWSYRDMNWYEVPDSFAGDLSGKPFSCLP